MQNEHSKFVIILVCMFISYFAIVCTAVLTEGKGYENMLLVNPKSNYITGIDTDKIEQINDDNFMITYEASQEHTVRALNSQHSVILTGTNYIYPFVMGYNLVDGGFFTQSAQKHNYRTVVLNEIAAFEMFGCHNAAGNKILFKGEAYTVVGVIKDGDNENKKLYMPIMLYDMKPKALLALLDYGNGITEEYIKNELKEAAVNDLNYDFINLEEVKSMIEEEVKIASLFLICFVLVIVLKFNLKMLSVKYRAIKKFMEQLYFNEILHKKPSILCGMALGVLIMAVLIVAIGNISLIIFKTCLDWKVFAGTILGLNYECFAGKIQYIKNMFILSGISFIVFMIFLGYTWFRYGIFDCKASAGLLNMRQNK